MTCASSDSAADGVGDDRLRGLRQEMTDLDFTVDDLAPGRSRYTSADGTTVVSIGHDDDPGAVALTRLTDAGTQAWTLTAHAACPAPVQMLALYTVLHSDTENGTITDLLRSIADAFSLDTQPRTAAAASA
ncbi:hypothetical protein [Phytohabitans kaempferiae]|uniref:Uncharacterized protein n=1 Tax=Phytohabitans kaempferiae TaxID=1620943 RepID=A0ABV6M9D6_9ACTN